MLSVMPTTDRRRPSRFSRKVVMYMLRVSDRGEPMGCLR
jgi:hypothetical protein